MDKNNENRIGKYERARRWKKTWQRIGSGLSAVVLFVTSYALVLPAATMEETTYCGLKEHVEHTASCYEMRNFCGLQDGVMHSHSDACYTAEQILICGQTEAEPHSHSEECYSTTTSLNCGQEAGAGSHSHGDGCYDEEGALICGLEESAGHVHGDGCYTENRELSCGKTETAGHSHSEECYKEEKTMTCGLEEGQAEHTHNEDCFKEELVCGKIVHVHTLQCFSNPNADTEDVSVWMRTLASAKLTNNFNRNLVAVARTQVGYHESTANYQVDGGSNLQGYSRYGAWYGDAYIPWNAAFVSFCLNYAYTGSREMAKEGTLTGLRNALSNIADVREYKAGNYAPKEGDLVLLSTESCGSMERVGIISELLMEDGSLSGIRVIEGDAEGEVSIRDYMAGDLRICGFIELPENFNGMVTSEVTVSETTEPTTEPTEETTEATEETTEATEETTEATEETTEATEETTEATEETTEATEETTEATEEIAEANYSEYDGLYTEEELAYLNSEHAMASANAQPVAGGGILQRAGRFMARLFSLSPMSEEPFPFEWSFSTYYVQKNDRYDITLTGNSDVKYQMNFHTDGDIPAGNAVIRIPATLMVKRDGTASAKPKEIAVPYGTLDNFQVTEKSPFNYYYDGDDLVFFNYKEIKAGTNAFWQVLYPEYNLYEIQDCTEWSNTAVATVTAPEGQVDSKNGTLSGIVDTHVVLTSLSKKPYSSGSKYVTPGLYTVSQIKKYAKVDESQIDLKNNVYVVWKVDGKIDANQPYDIYIKETPYIVTEEGRIYGVVVGGVGGELQESGDYEGYYKVDELLNVVDLNVQNDPFRYVVAAYPRDKVIPQTTEVHNDIDVKLHPRDVHKNDSTTRDADSTKLAQTHCIYDEYEWHYDPGNVVKNGKTTSEDVKSGFTDVYKYLNVDNDGRDGQDYGNLDFTVESIIRAYALTHRTNPENLGEYNSGRYVTLTTADDLIYARPISGGTDKTPRYLDEADYYFTSVRFRRYDSGYDFYEPDQSDKYEFGPTTSGELAVDGTSLDRDMYVFAMFPDQPGVWQPVGKADWNDSGVLSYTFPKEALDRQPYRVKAESNTVDFTRCYIDLTMTFRKDSPRLQNWYADGVTDIKVENFGATLVYVSDVEGVPEGNEYDGHYMSFPENKDNYSQYEGIDLAGTTSDLWGGNMPVRRHNAYVTLKPVEKHASAWKDSTYVSDPISGRYNLTYTLTEKEGYIVQSAADAARLEEMGFNILQNRRHVQFMDLLPKNVQYDGNKTKLKATCCGNPVDVVLTEKNVIPNWHGTGRTMLIFDVTCPENVPSWKLSGKDWYSSYVVTFGAYCEWEMAADALQDNNIAAFLPLSNDPEHPEYVDEIVGIPGDEVKRDNGNEVPSDAQYEPFRNVADLNGDGVTEKYTVLYMQKCTNVNSAIAVNSGITKRVHADSDILGTFDDYANVNPGETYTYQITVTNPDENRLQNIVIYDRLEMANTDRQGMEFNADGTQKIFDSAVWKGTLEGVDLSGAVAKGVTPVVYYSTLPEPKAPEHIAVSEDEQNAYAASSRPAAILTEENGWYAADSFAGDLSDVTAVAIDLSGTQENPFVLQAKDGVPASVTVSLKLRAPAEKPEGLTHTYNNARFTSDQGNTPANMVFSCVEGDSVRVTLNEKGAYELVKTLAENVPDAVAGQSFTFQVKDAEGLPYANMAYTLSTKDASGTYVPAENLYHTDEFGKLTLNADQKATFRGPGSLGLTAEELLSAVSLWQPKVTRSTQDKTVVQIFENHWYPMLYLQKQIKGLSRYDQASNYANETFFFRLQTKAGEQWVPVPAGTAYWKVSQDRTGYIAPIPQEKDARVVANDLGIIPIQLGETLAIFPGEIGTEYRLEEVADETGTPMEAANIWQPSEPEKLGTLAATGNSEMITNTKIHKDLFLTKTVTNGPETAGTFSFRLMKQVPVLNEENNPAEEMPWVPVQGKWKAYASAQEIAADILEPQDTTAIGEDGVISGVLPDQIIRILDLEPGVEYTLTEVDPGESYTLTKMTFSGSKTDLDTGDGFRFSLNVSDMDGKAEFTNDYRYRDLQVSKQVISNNKVDQSFTMVLEKVTYPEAPEAPETSDPNAQPEENAGEAAPGGTGGENPGEGAPILTGTRVVAAGKHYTVTNNLGKVVEPADRQTDAEGKFTLKSGETATFVDLDLIGTEYHVCEVWDDFYPQLSPAKSNENPDGGFDMTILEDETPGCTFVNGDLGMVMIRKTWTGRDADASAWLADKTNRSLGITLEVTLQRGEGEKYTPVTQADQMEYLLIPTVGDIQRTAMTDGTIHYKDPGKASLVLVSSHPQWSTWNYKITEKKLDAASGESDLSGVLVTQVPDAAGNYRDIAVALGTVTPEVSAHVPAAGENGDTLGESVAVLENEARTAKLNWIKKYVTSETHPEPGDELVWRLERWNGSAWMPAVGVEYILSYDCQEAYNGETHTTGGDGIITLMANPDIDSGLNELYQVAVGFYVPVKVNCTTGMSTGDYRVVELAEGSNPNWGSLVGYADEDGIFRLGASVAEPRGFVNSASVKTIRVEKVMQNGKTGEGPFEFRLAQRLNGASVPGAGLVYTVYNSEDDAELTQGTTGANGELTLMSGQYAIVTLPRDSEWDLREVARYPYFLGEVEITAGDGTASKDGDVHLVTGNILKPGPEINAMIPNEAVNVVFGFASEYNVDNLTFLGIADTDDSGSIKMYRAGDVVYILSDSPIRANPDSSGMLKGKSALRQANFRNLDTSSAEDMSEFFADCPLLTELDLRSWDVSGLTTDSERKAASGMFSGCNQLQTILAEDWTGNSAVAASEHVFDGCNSLVGAIPWSADQTDGSLCTPVNGYFGGKKPEEVLLSTSQEINSMLRSSDHSTVKHVYFDGNGIYADQVAGVSGTNLDEQGHIRLYYVGDSAYFIADDPEYWRLFTSTYRLFYEMSSLQSVKFNDFDTSNVTNMRSMFESCSSLTELDVSGFDTSSVTNMEHMFSSCESLKTLDVSGFNTSSVTDMSGMFSSCESLKTLDVSGFNTSSVTDMSGMFASCSSLTALDLSGFNTSSVKDMSSMFSSCSSLEHIYATQPFDLSNCISYYYIGVFYGCSALKSTHPQGLKTYDENKKTGAYAKFIGGYFSLPEDGRHFLITDGSGIADLIQSSSCTSVIVGLKSAHSNVTENLTNLDNQGKIVFGVKDGVGYILAESEEDWLLFTSTARMFYYCSQLTSITFESFDTSKVTNMRSMFYNCSSLTALNVSGLDTSSVTDMREMFSYCSSLRELDLSGLDTSRVTNMGSMFANCSSLRELDVSGLDTSSVTDMRHMFYYCNSLTALDVSGFDTSGVTNMNWMFFYCSSLTELNVSGFDTSSVTEMGEMFFYCSSLEHIYATQPFDVSKCGSNMSGVFSGCSALKSTHPQGLKTYDENKKTGAYAKFIGGYFSCPEDGRHFLTTDGSGIANLIRSSSCTSVIVGLKSAHSNVTENLTNLDNQGKIVFGVKDGVGYILAESEEDWLLFTSTAKMFYHCSELTSITFESFDTSRVTNMYYMFNNCSSLTELDVSRFDTSGVTSMSNMFYSCSSLRELDVSGFDTSSVMNMYEMFSSCSSLRELDVSGFNTSRVTSMYGMFSSCSSLTELDVSRFDTSRVTNMGSMFSNCSSLEHIYATQPFDVSKCGSDMSSVFYGCYALKSTHPQGLKTYDRNKTTGAYAKFIDGYFSAYDSAELTELRIDGRNTFCTGTQYTVTLLPDNTHLALNDVTWKVVKGDAAIDENGILTSGESLEKGDQITIMASSNIRRGVKATKTVTYWYDLESIAITGTDVIGSRKTGSFGVSYAPATIDNEEKGIVWDCSDNAEIDQNGKLTLKEGIQNGATITVTATSAVKDSISATKTVTYDASLMRSVAFTNVTNSSGVMGLWSEAAALPSGAPAAPAGVQVYKSGNTDDNCLDTCKLTISGYTEFTLKYGSAAEGNCDYTMIGALNTVPTVSSNAFSSKSYNITWQEAKFTGLDPGTTYEIYVVYRKDGSVSTNPDIGFFYVDEANCK